MSIVEVSQKVRFNAVHSLHRNVDKMTDAASRRPHGHDYEVEVCVKGIVDRKSGMVVDQGELRKKIEEVLQPITGILLDEFDGLGPATTENMAIWIWERLRPDLPDMLYVAVGREVHGDKATFRG